MRLVLIRHGESDQARRGLIAGVSACTGLMERGITQAQQLANLLANTGELNDCVALLSSPVLRARQTAEILATALPVRTIEPDCDLCELHPGEADGLSDELSKEEYRSRYGAFDLQTSPDRPFAPGGEIPSYTWPVG
jgi:broad specificity phosphatase PhoE